MSKNKDKYNATAEITMIRRVLKAYKGIRKIKDFDHFHYRIGDVPFLDEGQKNLVQATVRLFAMIEKQVEGADVSTTPCNLDDEIPF